MSNQMNNHRTKKIDSKMMLYKKVRQLGALVLLTAFIGGCGGVTQPQSSELNPGVLIADFENNHAFNSSSATAKQDGTGSKIQITATDLSEEIVLTFPNSLGTFTAADNHVTSVSWNQYLADSSTGSCHIRITQLSPTVKGTFTANTIDASISDSVRVITSGSFNASY
jgi:hypothetical protein